MFRFKMLLACLLSLVVVVGLSGCAKEGADGGGGDTPTEGTGNGEAGSTTMHDDGDHEHAEGDHEHENADMQPVDIEANLAQLSEEDRALVEKQNGLCLVAGEGHELGSMGVPYKATVNGVDVLLCCEGCEPMLKEDPEKYLAKLEKNE